MSLRLADALALATDPLTLVMTSIGILVGLLFGLLPGLSGLTALAVLLPFIYGMEPMAALGFLLGGHAAVCTGGSVTAICLGIPGAPANAATVRDGFALQQHGQGGRAVGAALFSSALGGLLGALVLVVLLPWLAPVIYAFGAPEIFLLALLGITWAAMAAQGSPCHALAAAFLGLFLSTVGYQRITGVPRFWFGHEYLLDGIRLIPLVLGLFAVPEILRLACMHEGHGRAGSARIDGRALLAGVRDVLVRPLLFLRSALIGVLVGIVPGVGGETAPFLAHAAARVPRRPEGAIEGVIAPESSNNAKEGGSLVPTLALGIPGSASMAILIGGFLVLGLEPGPTFLKDHLDIAAGIGLLLAFTNVAAVLLLVPLLPLVARFSRLPGPLLAPLLMTLAVTGAYLVDGEFVDVWWMFAFGALGSAMVRFEYSRPLLVLGFVLGPIIETYGFIAWQAYGVDALLRPVSLLLLVLLVVGLVGGLVARSPRPPNAGSP